MKTTINIIIATALMAVATSATAKSWRINNNAAAAPDFASINAAMSSAEVVAGDTLYLDPGTSLSGSQSVTKQVTIIGPGYMRADAPHTFAYCQDVVTLQAAYAKVEGVVFDAELRIGSSHINVERCKFTSIVIGSANGYAVTAQYANIRQCYGKYIRGIGSSENRTAHCKIENCILKHNSYENVISSLYNPIIRNNYLNQAYDRYVLGGITSGTITNNIILQTREKNKIFDSVENSIAVSNNVISADESSLASYFPDNKYGYNTEADIFTLTGMNDQRYQLKDDSPAKGYATDGGDCGPYGGLMPYVAGGLPNGYPYYTKAIVPAKSKDGKVNVSLKIKMQNE